MKIRLNFPVRAVWLGIGWYDLDKSRALDIYLPGCCVTITWAKQ